MDRKILITGSSGFMGGQLVRHMAGNFEVHGTHFTHRLSPSLPGTFHQCDVSDARACRHLLDMIQPEWVIHAAAMTNSNDCARNPEEAAAVNAVAAGQWATACHERNMRLLYLSTDLVFSGETRWNREDLTPTPVCTYGISKYRGEILVRKAQPDAIIVRSALQYGWSATDARSFTELLVENLRAGRPVHLFQDEFRTPLYSLDACEAIRRLVLAEQPTPAFLHLAGTDRISRYAFGMLLCRQFGFDENLLVPNSVANASFLDARPRDCSMDITTMRAVFPDLCRNVAEGITLFHAAYSGNP